MSLEVIAKIKEAEAKANEIIKNAELEQKNIIAKAQEEAKAKKEEARKKADADKNLTIENAQQQAKVQALQIAEDVKNQCADLKEASYKKINKAVDLIVNTITGS